jgi:hypothetical protein
MMSEKEAERIMLRALANPKLKILTAEVVFKLTRRSRRRSQRAKIARGE